MRNVENRMHSVRIGYYFNMAAPIGLINNAFHKDTAAVSLDRVIYPIYNEGHLPNFIVNNTKYQQRFCSFMTRIAYMYTSLAPPSEEIRNASTICSGPAFFMKQVNFLNKIVTS